jgi:hypothetical protein
VIDLTAAAARLVDDAERQGFPRVVSDPSVIAKIAGIIADGTERDSTKRAKKKTAGAITSPAVPEASRVSGAA